MLFFLTQDFTYRMKYKYTTLGASYGSGRFCAVLAGYDLMVNGTNPMML